VVELAAGLCESIARDNLVFWGDAGGAAVQAATLRGRAGAARAANAGAYAVARRALGPPAAPGQPGADAALRAALIDAAESLLAVVTTAADCAGLAAEIAQSCEPSRSADAAGAAELTAAAARSAQALLEINLALGPDDERRGHVRAIVAAAEADCRRARHAAAGS
jgi:hypothetical protein